MRKLGGIPGRRLFWTVGAQRYLRGLRKSATFFWYRLTESEDDVHQDLAQKAKVRELEEWDPFKVFAPAKLGTQSKDFVGARRVLTWKEGYGANTVKARFVAKGYQDPDLREGYLDIAGCVSRRAPLFQSISLGSLRK